MITSSRVHLFMLLMTQKHPIEFIEQPDHLLEFCQALAQSEWMALDTEFMRERTYFPVFCLLQVAIADRLACIDLLALPDLDPLKDVLLDGRIPKIIHSGRQDMELFFSSGGHCRTMSSTPRLQAH